MNIKPVLRRVARLGVALVTITTFVLAGCGGGGGASSGGSTPANITGRFVDATVVGIAYKCGTSTAVAGLTNANGEYTCPSGQAVAFYVGDILIGQVSSPLAVITPLDMVGAGATPSNTTVANIVRFLMSISSTDPATGTITIDPAVMTAAAGQTADFTAASSTVLDTLIPTLKPGATIYTSAQATAHVSASINGLFAGNYAGTYSGSYSGNWTVTIAADGTVSGLADGATVSGTMATTLSTGSTYGFSGTAGGTPWVGTLNISSKVFSGTWNDGAGSSGTWTGTVSSTPPVTTPTVTGFSPTSGAVGTSVTITGTNLGSFTPAPLVKFGTTTATVSAASAASITVTVPAGLAAGNSAITLSNFDGTGVVTVGTFNVTAAATVPAAPVVTPTVNSSTQITLNWPAVSGATSYTVYRSTVSGFTPAAANQIAANVAGTSHADSGLTAATAYFYRVVANNAVGASPASAEVTATTQAAGGGGGTGVTLSTPFNGLSSFAASATAESVSSGVTMMFFGDVNTGTLGYLQISHQVAYGTEVLQVNVISASPYTMTSLNTGVTQNCALTGTSSLCSAFGINFNRAAGTVSFSNTPLSTGLSGSGTTLFTISGNLTFTPF
jgi:hypothetical protein